MATLQTVQCILCEQPLPEGKGHPDYLGLSGWGPGENELINLAGVVGQFLSHAQTVQSALLGMMRCEKKEEEEDDKQICRHDAHGLSVLLGDLLEETRRHTQQLQLLFIQPARREA